MSPMKCSSISGFYKLTSEERLRFVRDFSNLNDEDMSAIYSMSGLKLDSAERMIENVIGGITIPLGIAVNFLVNGKDYLIPMAIEEPSVIAACSKAAGIARVAEGFTSKSHQSIMISQIQVMKVADVKSAEDAIISSKEKILEKANEQTPTLHSLGGGANDLATKVLETSRGKMLIVELYVDCKDAMGANACNTMAEAVSPIIESLTGGKVTLRILSNLPSKRLVTASAIFKKDRLGGNKIIDGILDAYAFAESDQYRCTTHNKGVMNGVIAVALATGQDTRALEAGAHAYSCRDGKYHPLTSWKKNVDGDLVGTISIPIAVGTVGGASSVHPTAKACLKILGVKSAGELGEVMASVGLAQNLAALRALVSEGIQSGHMKLHSRNIAVSAGAEGKLIDKIAERMIDDGVVNFNRAKEILEESRGQ